MKERLRIGSVGTSKIMEAMQEAIRQTDGLEATVICSRDWKRAEAFAKKVGVSAWCDDFQSLIHREDVDVVYIASPNVLHPEQAAAAMKAGKHVIVEKPAATKAEDVRRMRETAEKNGVYFFEAISTIFMPNYLALKALLPDLGKVEGAKIHFGRYSSQYDNYLQGKNPNIFNPVMKGGALNDMGIYGIHTMLDLFGRPDSTSYEAVYASNGADLQGTLTAKYPEFICKVLTAKDHDIDCGCWLYCENGWFAQEGTLNDFVNCKAEIYGEAVEIKAQPECNRLIYELARFRDAILERQEGFFQQMCRQSELAAEILENSISYD